MKQRYHHVTKIDDIGHGIQTACDGCQNTGWCHAMGKCKQRAQVPSLGDAEIATSLGARGHKHEDIYGEPY